MIFNSYAKKTNFQFKGLAQSLVLKVRVFGIRKWPRARFQAFSLNSASANWPGDEAVRERLQKNSYSQGALCTLTDDYPAPQKSHPAPPPLPN